MSMNFTFDHGRGGISGPTSGRPGPDDPFRILVIGDFSGRASRGVKQPLAGRKAHGIDIDTLDGLPKSLGTLVVAGGVEIDLLEIDDLHPDELFRKHAVFASLRSLRKRLSDPKTFGGAAAEVQSWHDADAPRAQMEPKPGAGESATPANDFEALLSGGSVRPGNDGPANARVAVGVDQLIRNLVGSMIVPAADPRQDKLIATVDAAIAEQMRRILHDPAWQGVEAAYRGVQMLTQRIELGEDITLAVLDASADELRHDLACGGAGLSDRLVTMPVSTAGGHPWSAIVVLHDFAATQADANLAARLGSLAAAAGAPLLAGAHPSMLNLASFEGRLDQAAWPGVIGGKASAAWTDAAGSAGGASVALVAPRFLLRLPYGPSTDPVDGFDFDEASSGAHAAYLWGNGALLVAMLYAQAFADRAWQLTTDVSGEITDLPVHVRLDGSMQPCGEAWLSETAAASLAAHGICPLVSIQNRGSVRITRVKAISGGEPAARWG